MKSHSPLLAEDQIDRICEQFMEEDKLGQHDAAWESLQPLVRAQPEQRRAALALLELVEGGWFSRERALELLQTIHAAHKQDDLVLSLLGTALEQARDIDMLNAAPPEHSLFAEVTECLGVRAREVTGTDIERNVVEGLSTAARMMARQYDNFAEASARRLVELAPGEPSSHYNYGLFLKTRGRFREGMIENQRALELAEEVRESYQWNLGICATGAGEGAVALEVWKRLGNKIEMGRFELPEGRYPQCKVRLAERTLAERNVDNDDPGLEETIWLERLSPCHGIIRSVLYQDLGVDYGDVVLIDGAPITYHKYGDEEVPVFPHLATLVRQHYQFFDFAGTQESEGQIADASRDLDRDCIVYSHSEQYRVLCAECWRNPGTQHKHEASEAKNVVFGRIAAPPDIAPQEIVRQLDDAMTKRATCHIFVPDLCEAAGLLDRARFEALNFGMLRSNED